MMLCLWGVKLQLSQSTTRSKCWIARELMGAQLIEETLAVHAVLLLVSSVALFCVTAWWWLIVCSAPPLPRPYSGHSLGPAAVRRCDARRGVDGSIVCLD